jgi:hypothetical protein
MINISEPNLDNSFPPTDTEFEGSRKKSARNPPPIDNKFYSATDVEDDGNKLKLGLAKIKKDTSSDYGSSPSPSKPMFGQNIPDVVDMNSNDMKGFIIQQ